MLLPVSDLIKPASLLRHRHLGIVVVNVDPDNLGRIKVKIPHVLETQDLTRLPWIYPWRGASQGASPGNGTSVVPELNTQVYVTFPEGNPYSAFYEAAPITHDAVTPVTTDNPVSEAGSGELPSPNTDPSNSTNMITHAWQTTRGNPNWLRIDKAQGKVELFMSEPGLFFSFDRGGNVQLKTPGNVDFDIGGKFTVKTGGDMIVQNGGVYAHEASKDLTLKTAADLMLDIAGDSVEKVSGDRLATIGGDDGSAITGSRSEAVTGNESLTVMGGRDETIMSSDSATVLGSRSATVTGNDSTTVTGVHSTTAAIITDTAGIISHN